MRVLLSCAYSCAFEKVISAGRLKPLALGRQSKLENGTAWHVRANPQATTMRFNDRATNGQPDAQAVGFGGKERFEHTLRLIGGQANADVRYCKEHES